MTGGAPKSVIVVESRTLEGGFDGFEGVRDGEEQLENQRCP